MPPIDTKRLFKLLQKMCSEVKIKSLEYLLSTKRSTVLRLLDNDSYWPLEDDWFPNAVDYNRRCKTEISVEDFTDAGIRKLIKCCPSPTMEITSLEERIEDLINSIFLHFYDNDIAKVKNEICTQLEKLGVNKNEIDHIKSLDDLSDISIYLAISAKEEGIRGREERYKAANKNKRKKANHLVHSVPVMVDTKRYIRREDKTKELLDLLAAGDKHVFISAGGGMGKTSFIAEVCYAATDYVPHYCVFQGNIKATIAALNFQGCHDAGKKEDEVYRDKISLLRGLDKNCLLIIDQFEGTEELFDEYYQDLETIQIPIIFATRSRFDRPTVTLEPFDAGQLLSLIEFYCGNDFVTYHKKDFVALISLAERNTLFVDLLGRFFKRNRNGIPPAQLLKSMESGVLNGDLWRTTVDSDYKDRRKKTILERLEMLFDLSFLSEEELHILAAVASHQDNGVSTQEFIGAQKQLFPNVGDVIDDLITKGWLHEKDTVPAHLSNLDERLISQMSAAQLFKRLSVHPLVQMVIINKVNALCGDTAANWNDLKLFAYASLSGASSTSKVSKQIELIWTAIDHNTIGRDEYLSFSSELAKALAKGSEASGIDSAARGGIINYYLNGYISLDHDFQQVSDKLKLLLDIWGRVSASFGEDSGKCSTYLEYALKIWQLAMPQETPCLCINPWFDYKDDQRRCSDIALTLLQQLVHLYSTDSKNKDKLIDIHVALGLIKRYMRSFGDASKHLEQALALLTEGNRLESKQVIAIYMNLAASKMELNDISGALKVFDDAYHFLTKDKDTYTAELLFVCIKNISLCLKNVRYQEALPCLQECTKLPLYSVVNEPHLLVDFSVVTRDIAATLDSDATLSFLDDFDKHIISEIAGVMVTYYQHHVKDMTENIVAQHFQQNGVLKDKKTLTKYVPLDPNGQRWLTNNVYYRTGYAIPDSEYKSWQLLKMQERLDLAKEYSSTSLSRFVAMYDTQFKEEIQKQLELRDLAEYECMISSEKVIFGYREYMENDYDRDSIEKETFRQNLLALLKNNEE